MKQINFYENTSTVSYLEYDDGDYVNYHRGDNILSPIDSVRLILKL